jgi:hypothetical protein
VVRLPFARAEAEAAAVAWLEHSARSVPQAGLMLSLFYLMRGRTPEALRTFAALCPPGAGAGDESDGNSGRLAELRGELQALLRGAAEGLPAVQRALVVGRAPAPGLRAAEGAEEGGAGVALAAAVPGLDAGGLPALLAEGPTLAETPLVGSIPALSAAGRRQGVPGAGVGVGVEQQPSPPPPVAPLLFGGGGGGLAAAPAVAPRFDVVGAAPSVVVGGQHELDRVLGLGGAGDKGRRPLLRGGGTPR